MRDTPDYMPVNDAYEPDPRSYQPQPERRGLGSHRAALIIQTVADVAAGFLVLWILLYLLDANQANVFVGFVEGMAGFLAGWSQDIFTMDTENLRVLLNYGLPALIYLGVGHGLAIRMRSM
jgi:hypothetical protein